MGLGVATRNRKAVAGRRQSMRNVQRKKYTIQTVPPSFIFMTWPSVWQGFLRPFPPVVFLSTYLSLAKWCASWATTVCKHIPKLLPLYPLTPLTQRDECFSKLFCIPSICACEWGRETCGWPRYLYHSGNEATKNDAAPTGQFESMKFAGRKCQSQGHGTVLIGLFSGCERKLARNEPTQRKQSIGYRICRGAQFF